MYIEWRYLGIIQHTPYFSQNIMNRIVVAGAYGIVTNPEFNNTLFANRIVLFGDCVKFDSYERETSAAKRIEILKNAVDVFTRFCVEGIKANAKQCSDFAEKSYGIAAALNPYIGYSKAAEIVKESVKTGKTLREIILKRRLIPEAKLKEILSPEKLTQP